MTFGGYPEIIEQALIIRVALEALIAIITVLFSLTIVTFVVYLIGVFQLCSAEDSRMNAAPISRGRMLLASEDHGADTAIDGHAESVVTSA